MPPPALVTSAPSNPLVEHQLPSTLDMVLDQPVSTPPKTTRRLVLGATFLMFGFTVAVLCSIGAEGVTGDGPLIPAHRTFALCWFLFWLWMWRSWSWIAALTSPLVFYAVQWLPARGQWLLAYLALFVLSAAFAGHRLCEDSAAPNEPGRRAAFRDTALGLALLSALLLYGPLILTLFLPYPHWLTAALVAAGIALVQAAFALVNLVPLARAWASWVSYNGRDRLLPGIYTGDPGPRSVRMLITYATLAVVLSAILNASFDSVSAQPERSLSTEEVQRIGLLVTRWPILLFGAGTLLFVYPTILVFLGMFLPVAPLLGFGRRHRAEKERHPEYAHAMALALRDSPNATERSSVWLGSILSDNCPALIPRALFDEHAYIRGDPGSGKTAALCALIEQLMSFEDATVHIFDLKGHTPELFEAARAAAGRSRRPVEVRWFSDRLGHSSHVFNLFSQPFWRELTPSQRAALLCAATGTDYGGIVDYGPGWYGDANFENVADLFERDSTLDSFAAIAARFRTDPHRKKELGSEVSRAGEHVRIACKRFARVPALNAANSIDLNAGFDAPQVVYWGLSGSTGHKTSGDVCRLALAALITAAGLRREKPMRVYVVMDEFQRALGKNLEYILETARSLGVGMILANQTIEALGGRDVDLRPILRSCCRVQWSFAVSDPKEQQEMAQASGEAIERLISRSRSYAPGTGLTTSRTTTASEAIRPALPVNLIKQASARRDTSILLVTRNEGFAQFDGFPVVLKTPFHISRAEYERRKAAPWPDPQDGTIVPEMPKPAPPPEQAPSAVIGTDTVGPPPRTPKTKPRKTPPAAPGEKSRRGNRGTN